MKYVSTTRAPLPIPYEWANIVLPLDAVIRRVELNATAKGFEFVIAFETEWVPPESTEPPTPSYRFRTLVRLKDGGTLTGNMEYACSKLSMQGGPWHFYWLR